MSKAGLYVHVPFCRRKCPYCAFHSTERLDLIPAYLQALETELKGNHAPFGPFDTLYIGGGTPSLLDEGQIDVLLQAIYRRLPMAHEPETTIEVNPADQNLNWFKALRRMGINRISLGVQAFDDKALQFLGRRHGAAEALSAVAMAYEAGFTNVGLDLIYGLPGQTWTSWRQTLQKALGFCPAHLSCYELSAEGGTPLGRRLDAGELRLPGEAQQARFLSRTAALLGEAGYIHYEVSNFAREEGLRSRHNSKYWRRIPYLGLGPSAHSFFPETRWWNHASVEPYLSALQTGRSPLGGSEQLTPEQVRMEEVLLGLRTLEGIDARAFEARHAFDILEHNREGLAKMVSEGFIVMEGGHIRCTARGLAVADRLAMDIVVSS